MDKYRKQQSELDKLKTEFISLETEEQVPEFNEKMKDFVSSKSEEEIRLLQKEFIDGAEKACEEAEQIIEHVNLRLKLEPIYDIVSWSYIAEKYFGKSRGWLNQRINGFNVNGKEAFFTKEEKQILADALQDIGKRLNEIALILSA